MLGGGGTPRKHKHNAQGQLLVTFSLYELVQCQQESFVNQADKYLSLFCTPTMFSLGLSGCVRTCDLLTGPLVAERQG